MWLRNLGRDGNSKRGSLSRGAKVALAAALAMSGCSADYVENSTAPVLLVISELNDGAQLDSDVRNGENSDFVCENEVDVKVTVQNKNPNAPTATSSAVLLESYEVRYTRSDGRGVEGVDVPYRITGTLATRIGIGDDITFPLEVVRRQAKQEPPLENINQTTVLTVNAQVTLFGKTISEQRVSASASMQIDFANFGDKETSCPQQ
jgi:hypothetical protein